MSNELYAATAKTITTTTTVSRKDPGGVAPISCPDQGTECTVTTTITTEIKIANVEFNSITGVYKLTTNIWGLTGTVDRDGQSFHFNHAEQAITFPSGSFVTITECFDFPELNNYSVNIAGITSNSSGDYIVYFEL